MGLKHVVVTSVDRDDVADRGAGQFAATIRALKAKLPDCSVELLTPDFLGVEERGARDGARRTARGLQPQHRDRPPAAPAHARREGELRRRALAPAPRQGGRRLPGADEVRDHRRASARRTTRSSRRCATCARIGVDVVTIGQYLQPSSKHVDDRPLGAPRRVPLAPRAGRGARLRLGLRRPARALELPRRRAEHAADTGRGAVATDSSAEEPLIAAPARGLHARRPPDARDPAVRGADRGRHERCQAPCGLAIAW